MNDDITIALGCRGFIVYEIQRAIWDWGPGARVDGIYGRRTQGAVRAFASSKDLNDASGDVTLAAAKAMGVNLSIERRCLQLTNAFEGATGSAFDEVVGNFDGAGPTVGLGYTWKYGELQKLLLLSYSMDEKVFLDAFGFLAAELLAMLGRHLDDQRKWAVDLTHPRKKYLVIEPWRSAFERWGQTPAGIDVQWNRWEKAYWRPAREYARRAGLTCDRGLALCADICFQQGPAISSSNGGLTFSPHREKILNEISELEGQYQKMLQLARRMARGRWTKDILARKGTIARGEGKVHGRRYDLKQWGFPAP